MTRVFLFPGQGSQTIGMGKALAEQFPVAKAVFDEVDAALSQKLSALMFSGAPEELTLTENAQPAIMAVSIAALRVLEAETGMNVAKDAAFVAGHSLGEYSALCAAGSLSLSETARLLKLRGQSMQRAVPAGKGAMAVLIGAELAQAEVIAAEAAQGEVCSVANDNAPGQVVLSGTHTAIERAIALAKAQGIKRAMLLQVSAPFHCSLMAPAAGVMSEALGAAQFTAPSVPLVANVTAEAVQEAETIRRLLVDQVTGQVRWRESMQYLAGHGVTDAVELGAGKVLSGLMKRIAPQVHTLNIGEPADVAAFAS